MKKQLDLFEWTPPAKVVAFPSDRLTATVRRVAADVMKGTERDADRVWQRALARLQRSLASSGFDEAEAHRQSLLFHRAVENEMWRQTERGHPMRPDGAA